MEYKDVAVGVITRRNPQGESELLLAQRPSGKPFAGYWEFPGGKQEPGEAIHQTLNRELYEELGIQVLHAVPWRVLEYVYPHAAVRLHFFLINTWLGPIAAREQQAWCWQTEITVRPLLPALESVVDEAVAAATQFPIITNWHCGRHVFAKNTFPLLMGIVNVTPDSFLDFGRCNTASGAIKHAERLLAEGADILDIGGESSRPNATPITPEEEWHRLEPVLKELIHWPTAISVDTYHAITMQRALDMGVDIINDISGFSHLDNQRAVINSNCGLCVMHAPAGRHIIENIDAFTMIKIVYQFLSQKLETLTALGVKKERICVDVGFGFGKDTAQNWSLLSALPIFTNIGQPLLVGISNKRFIGNSSGRAMADRQAATLAAQLLALEKGAHIIRAHRIAEMVDARAMWRALHRAAT